MKLRTIAESSLYMVCLENADSIALEQSTKNFQVMVLSKLREFLNTIGLSQGKSKHSIIQPITSAAPQYSTVKNHIASLMLIDAKRLLKDGLGSATAKEIGQKWGFRFPTNYYDVKTGQMGAVTVDGAFDDLLHDLAGKALRTNNEEDRIKLLSLVASF